MNTYLIADQILQYALNALMAFVLFTVLTEGVIRLFKLGSGRTRAFLRLVPPARLFLEPFLLLAGPIAAPVNVSIFSCSHPFQYFMYNLLSAEIKAEMEAYQLKTLIGAFLLQLPEGLILTLILFIGGMTIYRVGGVLLHYASAVYLVKKLQKRGDNLTHRIDNAKLLEQLRASRAEIVCSDEVAVPFAGWGKVIVVPKGFDQTMTREEFHAVISHELEHLCFHDNAARLFYQCVSSVHWWVPMSRWFNKVEHEQEIACDSAIFRYGLEGISLATALKKSVEKQDYRQLRCAAFLPARTSRSKSRFMDRIQTVLDEAAQCKPSRLRAFAGCCLILAFIFTLGLTIC